MSDAIFAPLFQLSALSQNDQPNPSCSGCSVGKHIIAKVVDFKGGGIFPPGSKNPYYPASNTQFDFPVLLPWPNSGLETPTWYFVITQGLQNFEVTIVVYTPGYIDPDTGVYHPALETPIKIKGSDMPTWVAQNQKQKTNQVYQYGDCGIFGFAQKESDVGVGYDQWIYTVTGGVCDPKIRP